MAPTWRPGTDLQELKGSTMYTLLRAHRSRSQLSKDLWCLADLVPIRLQERQAHLYSPAYDGKYADSPTYLSSTSLGLLSAAVSRHLSWTISKEHWRQTRPRAQHRQGGVDLTLSQNMASLLAQSAAAAVGPVYHDLINPQGPSSTTQGFRPGDLADTHQRAIHVTVPVSS